MNYFMYSHSGSKNHGCEAIVRSTCKILNLNNQDDILYSYNRIEDEKYYINEIINVDDFLKKNKNSFKNLIASFMVKYFHDESYAIKISFEHIINNYFKSNTIGISIGGDVYCYNDYNKLSIANKCFRENKIKTILWGCSVEKDLITNEMKNDLKNYNLIFTRESISYETLKIINPNTYLYPDPAFQLDRIDLPLPECFVEDNTVGINISPLIMSCETNKGITKNNYIQLIDYIIKETDMNIALIPHVVWENNDDRKPLKELYDIFKHTHRICLIDDHNCMELKGFISRCRFFVGARTHASIAAYSSCVPTLVIGYSVKAKGIAKDIFGTYDNYVLPVQSLQKKDDLVKSFQWVVEHETDIKKHLQDFIPTYSKIDLNEIRCLIKKS